MPATALISTPRPRMLIHPGSFNPVRIQSLAAPSARHFRLSLEPGRSLFEALVEPLMRFGVGSASTTILGGWFESIDYCVAPPDPSGQSVIAYSAPRQAGEAYLIFGNATLGKSMKGKPLVHCHGTIRTGNGTVQGGHILPERAIIGAAPIPVLVTTLDGFDLQQAFDPETNMPLLQPLKENSQ